MIKEYPIHKINPFVTERLRSIGTSKRGQKATETHDFIIGPDGNTKGVLTYAERPHAADNRHFTKVFDSPDDVWIYLSFWGLRLFCYIMKHLKRQSDEITFTPGMVGNYYKVSGSTTRVYASVTELLDLGVIARTETPNVYFINPSIFFKGDWEKQAVIIRKRAYIEEITTLQQ